MSIGNIGPRSGSYLGTRAGSPPNLTFAATRPGRDDNSNALYAVGDFWVYTAAAGNVRELWYLSSLSPRASTDSEAIGWVGNYATWIELATNFGPTFYYQGGDTIGGPSGDPAVEVDGIINIYGDGVGITSTSADNTITFSLVGGGDAATNFQTDGAAATPLNGTIGIAGGANIHTYAGDANTVTIAVNDIISLPDSDAVSPGFYQFAGVTFLSNYGDTNTFVGPQAGNTTLQGGLAVRNVALGYQSLNAIDTGYENMAAGNGSLKVCTTGYQNVAFGEAALNKLTTGHQNSAFGSGALSNITTGSDNVAFGENSGYNCSSGSESSNVFVGSLGIFADSNTVRIGEQGSGAGQQQDAYIAGVFLPHVALNANQKLTIIDVNGKLGSIVNGASGTILQSNGAGAAPTWVTNTGGFTTGHTDSGDATVAASALTFAGNSTLIHTTGSGSTVTIGQQTNPTISGTVTLSALGNGAVVANGSGVLSSVTPGSAGTVLTSAGAGSAPVWSAAGTGVASFTTNNAAGNDPVLPLVGVVAIKADGTILATNSDVAHQVTVGLGSGSATNGRVLIGGTSTGPRWTTLTAGTGISVGNADGDITITNTAPGGGGTTGLVNAITDSGTATESSNNMNFLGNTNLIRTTASGLTVTIGQVTNPTISGTVTLSGLGTGLVESTAGVLSALANGTNGQVLTIAAGVPSWAAAASSFTTAHTDSGDATVAAAALSFLGNANFARITGAGSTVTINQATNPTLTGTVTLSGLGLGVVQSSATGVLSSSNGLDGQVLISRTAGGAPIWANITSPLGTINITRGPNTMAMDIVTSATGVQSVNTNSGSAIPSGAGVLNINGTDNINTSATGNTVTVKLNKSIFWPVTNTTTSGAGAEGKIYLGTPLYMHAFGTDNTWLGNNAGNLGLTVGSASEEVGIGANSLDALTTGQNNTAVGFNTLTDCTTGASNSAFGHATLANVTTGAQNCAMGNASGASITTGSANVLMGFQTGNALVTNGQNVHLGHQAGATSTAAANTYIGYTAGDSNITGVQNTFLGHSSGTASTDSNCTFLGYQSGLSSTTATSCTFVGNSSGTANTTGDRNTYIGGSGGGLFIGGAATTGSDNILIGYNAGSSWT